MTHLTWGISIPGYSYPSAAQKKLFNKRYPRFVIHMGLNIGDWEEGQILGDPEAIGEA